MKKASVPLFLLLFLLGFLMVSPGLRAEPVVEILDAPPDRVYEVAYRYLFANGEQYKITRENREMRIINFEVHKGNKVIEANGVLEVIAQEKPAPPAKGKDGKKEEAVPAKPRAKLSIDMKKLPHQEMIYLAKRIVEKFRADYGDS